MLGTSGILLLYGLILAWRTRNLEMIEGNDSKTIGLAVYNVCIFSSTAVLIGFTVVQPGIRYGMIGLFIILSTTGSLCLLFLPKVMVKADIIILRSRLFF